MGQEWRTKFTSIDLRLGCRIVGYINLINSLGRLGWASYLIGNDASKHTLSVFMIIVAVFEFLMLLARIGFNVVLLFGLVLDRINFMRYYLIFTIFYVEWVVIEMFLKVPPKFADVENIIITRLSDFGWNMYCLLLMSKYVIAMKTET